MSSYRNNYSSDKSSSNYYNSNSGNYSSIPASRRPDGSYREEIHVRPGHVPQGERQSYVPPQSRTSSNYSGYSPASSVNSVEDRVESWADLDAPVLSEYSESESNVIEESEVVEAVKVVEACTLTESCTLAQAVQPVASEEIEGSGSPTPREPRKPSQLATAIDTAIDSEPGATRPIGRYAAQIANDERDGRTYTPRRYDSSSSYNSSYSNYNRGDYQGGYNRDNGGGYNSNWNRSGYKYNSTQSGGASSMTNPTATNSNNNNNSISGTVGNSSGEIRVEKEFKSFLEQLIVLRREMAVINAKLEYIRYFKSLDSTEINEKERARVSKEKDLVARMDAIFEAIDALSLDQ